MASRREKIEALLADDPNDAFLRYSLAMELDKEGQLEPSAALFRGLMADSPPQVAAFFMLAQQPLQCTDDAAAVDCPLFPWATSLGIEMTQIFQLREVIFAPFGCQHHII